MQRPARRAKKVSFRLRGAGGRDAPDADKVDAAGDADHLSGPIARKRGDGAGVRSRGQRRPQPEPTPLFSTTSLSYLKWSMMVRAVAPRKRIRRFY